MFFKEGIILGKDIFPLPSTDSYYLQDYHSRRGGANPLHDDYSRTILDLKDCDPTAVNYFLEKLNIILGGNFTIVTIPSHDAGATYSGMTKLSEELIKVNPTIINGTSCLIRHLSIPKLAHTKGFRDPQIIRDSLRLYNSQILENQDVLILDDVTTSGNSLYIGREFINQAGPRSICLLALGRTAS
jgi:predicted amidophosphoribosyltransferase